MNVLTSAGVIFKIFKAFNHGDAQLMKTSEASTEITSSYRDDEG